MSTNEKTTASDAIDDKERAQLLTQIIPKELKNWMTNVSDKLKDIPVWKLTIPGNIQTTEQAITLLLLQLSDTPLSLSITIVFCYSVSTDPRISTAKDPMIRAVMAWTLT